ncbi:cation-transporting P-type ATPase [Prescottella agglutinans]|uniref:Cation-transporting P-type ATPase n=1 Tax=Prescottella agglutinans TaxID=1644129 RepID=A0A438BCJ2_9NOCA|nr:cation-transporting P-type ATPase [Prescottella agglutinans]RVW08726.1 cation-transporting P-type ATPase [Prescottella agglutinans]
MARASTDALDVLATPGAAGLTSQVAAARLREDGPNRLPAARPVPAWRKLTAELTHFFAIMLWVAAGLAAVAGMPQLAVAIVVVIVVNGVFAFVQEERAEKASERLRDLLPSAVTVRRDGELRTVGAADVVVGDVMVLASGDRVPADGTVVVAHALALDESTLTGESEAVHEAAGGRVWAGTYAMGGQGEAVAVATASDTRLAGIAALTAGVRRPRSPLAAELHRVVRTIAIIAIGVGIGFFGLSLLVGAPAHNGFLFAVGVTVALVPEGLLPTVTLSLAMGAQRMAHRNALIRHLEAVETLGSTTVICTDKTGTLTQNRMTVTEAWTPSGTVRVTGEGYEPTGQVSGPDAAVTAARHLGTVAVTASQGGLVSTDGTWSVVGDPMEGALDAFARRVSGPVGAPRATPERRYAFDPRRRRESAISGRTLMLKGAPDSVLPRCARPDPDALADARRAVDDMAGRGLRVLAAAVRDLSAPAAGDATADDLERDLTLVGLFGIEDPPRPAVPAALTAARRAHIRVVMLTGDHPATAVAVAREIGLVDGVTRPVVVEGGDLPEHDVALGDFLDRDGVVVSRVSPEQKLAVARALQARGHVVAMTGDGVNDGPALREADIGVAMGRSGTDVAREAADLVLLDDDFSTIVAAVEQGRATYANIRRFLTYHLTANVAELTPFVVWALSGGRVPLAIGVLQVLCIDIVTDLLPALALGGEPPSRGVMSRRPERRHLMDRTLLNRVFGVLGPTESVTEMAAFLTVLAIAGWHLGGDPPDGSVLVTASGAAFTAVVLGQIANAFACRSATRPVWQLGWFTNRLLVWAVAAEFVVLVGLLTVGPVAALLGQSPPSIAGWAIAVAGMPALLGADYLHKRARHRDRGRAVSAGR